MISETQRLKLLGLLREVEGTINLLNLYAQGLTNKSFHDIDTAGQRAKKKLEDFLELITLPEVPMSHEDQISPDRPDLNLGARRIDTSHKSDDSFSMKALTQVYELDIIQLQKLIGKELGVPYSRVTITDMKRDVSHPMSSSLEYAFAGIRVTVKGE